MAIVLIVVAVVVFVGTFVVFYWDKIVAYFRTNVFLKFGARHTI